MYPKSKTHQLIPIMLIFVAFILFMFLTSPEPKDLSQEEFLAYNLISSEEKTFPLAMTIYPSNVTGLGETYHDVKVTYEGEDFFYYQEAHPHRDKPYLPLKNDTKTFGVLLPDEAFENMVLIFSEDKDFSKDESLYYTTFPQMDVQRATRLLTDLLDKYDYDLMERPTE